MSQRVSIRMHDRVHPALRTQTTTYHGPARLFHSIPPHPLTATLRRLGGLGPFTARSEYGDVVCFLSVCLCGRP